MLYAYVSRTVCSLTGKTFTIAAFGIEIYTIIYAVVIDYNIDILSRKRIEDFVLIEIGGVEGAMLSYFY